MKISTALGAAALTIALGAGVLAAPADATPGTTQARKAAATKVTLKASKSDVMSGKRVLFRGTAKPGAAGAKVVLQQRLDGKKSWSTSDTGKVGKSGKYVLADVPHTAGHRKYRVVVPAYKSHATGVSKPVSLAVYRWLDLTKIEMRKQVGTYKQTDVEFDTVKFGPAMVGRYYYQNGFSDWNLERDCLTLKARFGLSDASDASAITTISVVADGASVYEKSFALTQSQEASVKIKDAFRVSFSWTGTNPEATPGSSNYGVVPAMAEPQVLCAF